MRRIAVAIVTAFILGSDASILADTHYVSKTGSNTPPYTSWETAADSISVAVEASENWDTVRVGAGTFYEHSVWLKTGTTLVGAGIDSTILVSTEPGAFVTPLLVMGDSSHVEGFYLTGNGVDRAVLFTDGTTGTVRGNRIRGFNNGITASLISLINPSAMVIVEDNAVELCDIPVEMSDGLCIIRGNVIYPPFSGPAIFCLGASPTVERNKIGGEPPSLTRAERLRFYGTLEPLIIHESITIEFCPDFIVRNNIIWGGYTGVYVNNEDSPSPSLPWGAVENNTFFNVEGRAVHARRNNILVRNNVIADAGHRSPIVEATLDSVRFEYNLLWDFDIPAIWDSDLAVNNIFRNPMFEDTIYFRLQQYSPAIDAGDLSILDTDGSRSDIGYTGGPGGFSYEYLDLPPGVPRNFGGTRVGDEATLTWRPNTEADLAGYELFRDIETILSPDSELLIATMGPETTCVDTIPPIDYTHYYRLRAVDNQGNASELSDERFFVGAGVYDDAVGPFDFVLHPNYPNPFNASTRFEIDVPVAGRVNVCVYDVLGRRVETLHDGTLPVGRHAFNWAPERSGSGVYFVVAKFGETTRVRKALLLK